MKEPLGGTEYHAVEMLPVYFWLLVAVLSLGAVLDLRDATSALDVPEEIEVFFEERGRECHNKHAAAMGAEETVPQGTLTSSLNCVGAPRGCE